MKKLKVLIFILTAIFVLAPSFFYINGTTSVLLATILASKESLIIYLITTTILVGLTVFILILKKITMYFSLVLLIAFIVLFVYFGTHFNYSQQNIPNDGVKYYWVEKPVFLDSYHKLILWIIEGRDENYEIKGWLDNTRLVYVKDDFKSKNFWQYDISIKSSSMFKGSTEKLFIKTCEYEICVKPFIKSLWDGERIGFVSPDGNRFAWIAKNSYGPWDIFIFEK